MARSDRYTIERNKREIFSDFLINFDKNPVTGFLGKAINDKAIAQSLRNIILTNQGDWPFESSLGSKINSSLFELNDYQLQSEIRNAISEAIQNHEPRVQLINVFVNESTNANRVDVEIIYSILNIPDETFSLTTTITRVR